MDDSPPDSRPEVNYAPHVEGQASTCSNWESTLVWRILKAINWLY